MDGSLKYARETEGWVWAAPYRMADRGSRFSLLLGGFSILAFVLFITGVFYAFL